MSNIPYDWAFNANNSGSSIPGLLSLDTNNNLTIPGKISTDSGLCYTDGIGNITVQSVKIINSTSGIIGVISSGTVQYDTGVIDPVTNSEIYKSYTLTDFVKKLDLISDEFNTSQEYTGILMADDSQVKTDGLGNLTSNNISVGVSSSNLLSSIWTTYSDSASGSTTIVISGYYSLPSSGRIIISGTGIPDNTIVSSAVQSLDQTTDGSGNILTSNKITTLTISSALTADLPISSSVTIDRYTDTSEISFYTSGNSNSVASIKVTGSSSSTTSTMEIISGDTSFTPNTLDVTTTSYNLDAPSITINGTKIILNDLPTTDPLVSGQLWSNSGVLCISQG